MLPATSATPYVKETSSEQLGPSFFDYLDAIPVEALGFLSAAAVARLFFQKLSSPLFGIGIGLLTTKLVLKAYESYDSTLLYNLTKEVHKLNRKYPKLQLITFIFTLIISLLSPMIGFLAGTALGAFSAVILNIESHKLMLQANRKDKN